VQAAFELSESGGRAVEDFGIGDGDAALAGRFGDDVSEAAVEIEVLSELGLWFFA
jgi:hypothetical protein